MKLCLSPLHLSSPKRLCFTFVCMLVCLIVSLITPKKLNQCTKFGGIIGHGPRKNSLNFGVNTVSETGQGAFQSISLTL